MLSVTALKQGNPQRKNITPQLSVMYKCCHGASDLYEHTQVFLCVFACAANNNDQFLQVPTVLVSVMI